MAKGLATHPVDREEMESVLGIDPALVHLQEVLKRSLLEQSDAEAFYNNVDRNSTARRKLPYRYGRRTLKH
jgi:hypothetical protein